MAAVLLKSPPADGVLTSPSRIDPATWARTSRALINQLQDPQDRTALSRRLAEVHRNSTSGFAEPPTDPAAIAAADMYASLAEI